MQLIVTFQICFWHIGSSFYELTSENEFIWNRIKIHMFQIPMFYICTYLQNLIHITCQINYFAVIDVEGKKAVILYI